MKKIKKITSNLFSKNRLYTDVEIDGVIASFEQWREKIGLLSNYQFRIDVFDLENNPNLCIHATEIDTPAKLNNPEFYSNVYVRVCEAGNNNTSLLYFKMGRKKCKIYISHMYINKKDEGMLNKEILILKNFEIALSYFIKNLILISNTAKKV